MKIGILGSGDVGKSLADGFIKYGYDVMIGTEHKEKLAEWSEGKKLKVGSFSDAAKFGEMIVLAIKGSAAMQALKKIGAENLQKTVIDATNPIDDKTKPVNGVLKFFTNLDESLMEQMQKEFPQSHFVKAFSHIGAAQMVNPDFHGEKPSMFICGNDDSSKKQVTEILAKFGFETEDMGKAEAARAIEPLAILWLIPGFTKNEWSHAFRMIR